MQLLPGSIFELAEMQQLLAREWELARGRAALVASGPMISIDPLAFRKDPGLPSHPAMTRLHSEGDHLGGDLRCLPQHLPFESDSVQLIVARHIVDALVGESGIEGELARVLAPGGLLLVFGLNPLSPWRLWWTRQARPGMPRPRCRFPDRMRRTLVERNLSAGRNEYLGGLWPPGAAGEAAMDARYGGSVLQGAWLLAARKQRAGMRPVPLRQGRNRVALNQGLAQSPSRRALP